ncbi:MAG: hypothetical protein ACPGOV_05115 [Magnetovibrionaceae bacterium]
MEGSAGMTRAVFVFLSVFVAPAFFQPSQTALAMDDGFAGQKTLTLPALQRDRVAFLLRADTDGDRLVSRAEGIRQWGRFGFHRHDRDRNGLVSAQDAKLWASKLFLRADRNLDGLLTGEEHLRLRDALSGTP